MKKVDYYPWYELTDEFRWNDEAFEQEEVDKLAKKLKWEDEDGIM